MPVTETIIANEGDSHVKVVFTGWSEEDRKSWDGWTLFKRSVLGDTGVSITIITPERAVNIRNEGRVLVHRLCVMGGSPRRPEGQWHVVRVVRERDGEIIFDATEAETEWEAGHDYSTFPNF